ncbi:GDSL-type esterase/lipase family protein [Corynebacterium pseudopelargi]|uniref:Lipase 2 n=1 Tax=Corynebacterium pseudopelargi TaxID=2080757 RepID=A0A3G6ISJ8_9CORY|nr:GDSL-type esterase/lipase family protein [Corynebacterium pseudopelargi]AZA08592.1 Lipase 2 precursor [Corynebacterium pseudopelargi]
MKLRYLSALCAVACSAALAMPAAAQGISPNNPFASQGRELPHINMEAALDQATWVDPSVPQTVEPGNLVTFGDSIMANMTAGDAAFSMATKGARKANPNAAATISTLDPNINLHGCAQGTPSLPKKIAADLGVPLNDYSCPGATMYTPSAAALTIPEQVDAAIADGALNPQTRYVTLQGGYNDVYNNYFTLTGEGANDAEIAARINQPTQRDMFAAAIDGAISKIKQAAPNAKIALVGYHEITENTPAGWQCLYHIGEGYGRDNVWGASYAVPIFFDTQGEMNVQKWLAEAAQRHGVQFADERAFSAGHGECAAPADRWVAGILIDTTTGEHNLALHLTDEGVDAIGSDVANKIR